MRFVALIVGAGLAVAGLAGCGSTAEPVTGPLPSIAPSVPPSAGPSIPPSVSPSGLLASGVLVTLHGTVKDGVEPGCTLLTTASDTYLLLGGDKAALKTGATVTVYGTPAPDLMTTCQQGTPFRVTRVES
jgi:hypothetical protein